ncbi:MAG TPA: transporter substrate-binding domain-containing protein [Burkholderiales bacterium]|nr:transporter substrate-binding domain-containing protein [Burkholderiales bacterium]
MRLLILAAAALLTASLAQAQVADSRIADLRQAGKLRVGLFLPQFTKDPATGELRGEPAISGVARALADRIGVKMELIGHRNPRETIDCLRAGGCDVAIMAVDNLRTSEVAFSRPVMESDFTCLVPADSAIRRFAELDQAGVRIAAVRNHASTLALGRELKRAEVLTAETPDATFALLRGGQAYAMASARSVLLEFSVRLPGSRVLDDRYGFQHLALTVAVDKEGRLAYVNEFVREASGSGLLRQIIERAGTRGVRAPGSPS